MKRFYAHAEARAADDGYQIVLDGRPVRTPAKAPLLLPTRALAEAIAAEWATQVEKVQPHTMPLMTLASTALDRVAQRREQVVEEIAKYAETDLVCYRATHPPQLAARQQGAWQPLIDWVMLRYDAPLSVTSGVIPLPQSPETLKSLARAVAAHDTLTLAALHSATTACGSVVIALALLEGRIDAAGAFAASQLDETFQIEQWGEDTEQMRRRAALEADIHAAARFIKLLRAD